MFASFSLETFRLGLSSIRLHKLRSFLTTLGIICGVGAVICMLSIGEGASEAEMALIKLLGYAQRHRQIRQTSGGAAMCPRSGPRCWSTG